MLHWIHVNNYNKNNRIDNKIPMGSCGSVEHIAALAQLAEQGAFNL